MSHGGWRSQRTMRRQFVHLLSLSLLPPSLSLLSSPLSLSLLKYSSFSNPHASHDQETDYRQSPHIAIIVNQPLCLRRLTRTSTLAPLDYKCRLSIPRYTHITIAKRRAEWIFYDAILFYIIFGIIFFSYMYVTETVYAHECLWLSKSRPIHYDIEFQVRLEQSTSLMLRPMLEGSKLSQRQNMRLFEVDSSKSDLGKYYL